MKTFLTALAIGLVLASVAGRGTGRGLQPRVARGDRRAPPLLGPVGGRPRHQAHRRCRSSRRTSRRSAISAGTSASRSTSSEATSTVTVSGAGHPDAHREVQRRSGLRDPAARRNRHPLQAGRGAAQPSRRRDTTVADRATPTPTPISRTPASTAALDWGFEQKEHNTRAIVVVHQRQDRRRALRAGLDQGHAANQLVGRQEHHRGAGRHHRAAAAQLKVDDVAPIKEWRGKEDPRARDPRARPAAHEQRTRFRQSRAERSRFVHARQQAHADLLRRPQRLRARRQPATGDRAEHAVALSQQRSADARPDRQGQPSKRAARTT